jgi:ABC-type multidrug transport system fused ATPase/permease subunit
MRQTNEDLEYLSTEASDTEETEELTAGAALAQKEEKEKLAEYKKKYVRALKVQRFLSNLIIASMIIGLIVAICALVSVIALVAGMLTLAFTEIIILILGLVLILMALSFAVLLENDSYVEQPFTKVKDIVLEKLTDILVLCIEEKLIDPNKSMDEQKAKLRSILLNPEKFNDKITWVNFKLPGESVTFTQKVVAKLIDPSMTILDCYKSHSGQKLSKEEIHKIKYEVRMAVLWNRQVFNSIRSFLFTAAIENPAQQIR